MNEQIINGIRTFIFDSINGTTIINDQTFRGQIVIDGEILGENPIVATRDLEGDINQDAYSDGNFYYVKQGNDLVITKTDSSRSVEDGIIVTDYFNNNLIANGAPFGLALNREGRAGSYAAAKFYSMGNTFKSAAKLADERMRFAILCKSGASDSKFFLKICNEYGLEVGKVVIESDLGAILDPNTKSIKSTKSLVVDGRMYVENGEFVIPFSTTTQIYDKLGRVTSTTAEAKIFIFKQDGTFFTKTVNKITGNGSSSSSLQYIASDFSKDSSGNIFCSFSDQSGKFFNTKCNLEIGEDVVINVGLRMPVGAQIDNQDNSQIILDSGAKVVTKTTGFDISHLNLVENSLDVSNVALPQGDSYKSAAGIDFISLSKDNTVLIEPSPNSRTIIHNLGNSSKIKFVGFDKDSQTQINLLQTDTKRFSFEDLLSRARRDNERLDRKRDIVEISLPNNQLIIIYDNSQDFVRDRISFEDAISSSMPTPSKSLSMTDLPPMPTSSEPLLSASSTQSLSGDSSQSLSGDSSSLVSSSLKNVSESLAKISESVTTALTSFTSHISSSTPSPSESAQPTQIPQSSEIDSIDSNGTITHNGIFSSMSLTPSPSESAQPTQIPQSSEIDSIDSNGTITHNGIFSSMSLTTSPSQTQLPLPSITSSSQTPALPSSSQAPTPTQAPTPPNIIINQNNDNMAVIGGVFSVVVMVAALFVAFVKWGRRSERVDIADGGDVEGGGRAATRAANRRRRRNNHNRGVRGAAESVTDSVEMDLIQSEMSVTEGRDGLDLNGVGPFFQEEEGADSNVEERSISRRSSSEGGLSLLRARADGGSSVASGFVENPLASSNIDDIFVKPKTPQFPDGRGAARSFRDTSQEDYPSLPGAYTEEESKWLTQRPSTPSNSRLTASGEGINSSGQFRLPKGVSKPQEMPKETLATKRLLPEDDKSQGKE